MPQDVEQAFSMLLAELERYRRGILDEGAVAMRGGNFNAARSSMTKAEAISALYAKATNLHEEWGAVERGRAVRTRSSRQRTARTARLRRGERLHTGRADFRDPIVVALFELGGRAKPAAVLDLVKTAMGGVFTSADFAPRSGRGDVPYWTQTAYFARLDLVHEGLIRDDSPVGTWELTEAGKEKGQEILSRPALGATQSSPGGLPPAAGDHAATDPVAES